MVILYGDDAVLMPRNTPVCLIVLGEPDGTDRASMRQGIGADARRYGGKGFGNPFRQPLQPGAGSAR